MVQRRVRRRVVVAGPTGDAELVAGCLREHDVDVRSATDPDAEPADISAEDRPDVCLVTRSTVVDRLVPRRWVPLVPHATLGVFVQPYRLAPAPVRAWVARALTAARPGCLRAADRLELPRLVRESVRDCWTSPDRLETVLLAASELTSNAVQHSITAPTASVVCGGGRLLIEAVDDRPLDLPCIGDPDGEHPSDGLGHGLRIVAAVADRWGVTVHPTCKIVWCEFDQPPRV